MEKLRCVVDSSGVIIVMSHANGQLGDYHSKGTWLNVDITTIPAVPTLFPTKSGEVANYFKVESGKIINRTDKEITDSIE
tara:strand:- start:2095 stop:2334 length:240 start_codon:yes stop_codon:yes gene_type:complete